MRGLERTWDRRSAYGAHGALAALAILWVMGWSVLSDVPWMSTVFMIAAYLALLAALMSTTRRWRDWMNPLSLVLLVGFIRFGVPGWLLITGSEPDVATFHRMGLGDREWLLGHVLALLGLLGVVIGWHLPVRTVAALVRSVGRCVKPHVAEGVRFAALLGMLIGCAGLVVFVASNAPVLEVIRSGEFRRTEIQVGTGKFFYTSLLLIASSVVFSEYLLRERRAWWVALTPVAAAMLLFWVLGGRARALTAPAAGLLLLWYQRRDLQGAMKRVGAALIPLLPMVLYAGDRYRGGLGVAGLGDALSVAAVLEYARGAVWVDWGQLHSLAGAAAIGPAVLGGGIFLVLLWPLSLLLEVGGRSTGVFITETLVGFAGGRKWGFHASLIGDAYLNFGVAGVLVATTVFGLILRSLYAEMRRGSLNGAFYALAAVYGLRMFFESIEKFPETLTILVFVSVVLLTGRASVRAAPRRSR